jgi:hypothetical protein
MGRCFLRGALVELTSVDRVRGFVKGSIRLPTIACGRSHEPPLVRRLLGLRDSDLWSVTAEVEGLLIPQISAAEPTEGEVALAGNSCANELAAAQQPDEHQCFAPDFQMSDDANRVKHPLSHSGRSVFSSSGRKPASRPSNDCQLTRYDFLHEW